MGGRTSSSTNQTTTTRLPQAQQTNVDTLLRDSLAYYQGGGPKYFEGNTYAGPTAEQTQARQMGANYATGQGQQTANSAISANNYWLNPEVLTNYSAIPGYNATRQGIINDATRTLTDSTLPVLRDDAIINGQYGGTSQQIGEALATARTNEGIAQQLGNLDLGIYQQNSSMQNNALNRSGDMYNLGLAPSSTLETIGGQNRQDQQGQIDADVAKWNFDQMAPLLNLQAFQGLTGSAGQYGGTTTTQGNASASGGDGGMMQALGTVVMLAAMFMSHSSLKEDIKPADSILGKLRQLQINTWKYKGDSVTHIGPMAEEFHKIFGVGDGYTINIIDVAGVALGALAEIAHKLEEK
jgi:hypothetical protein